MIHLRTLGGVDLRDSAGGDMRPVLAQPKRLALLAYLLAQANREINRQLESRLSTEGVPVELGCPIHQISQSEALAAPGATSTNHGPSSHPELTGHR